VLQREIEHLLTRPVGRPPKRPIVWYGSFSYRAASWDKPRRVVAKVEWHRGELFPRAGFIVTNLRRDAERVVRFYDGLGVAEQWIKEGKNAVKWTTLFCHDFVNNQVRLQLFELAYNLGNFLCRVALPPGVSHWSLTTLLGKLIKIGAKVVSSARFVTIQMAEVGVPQRLFRAILRPDFTSAAGSLGMESSETRQGEWYLHLQSCVGELVRGPKWEISDRLDCS